MTIILIIEMNNTIVMACQSTVNTIVTLNMIAIIGPTAYLVLHLVLHLASLLRTEKEATVRLRLTRIRMTCPRGPRVTIHSHRLQALWKTTIVTDDFLRISILQEDVILWTLVLLSMTQEARLRAMTIMTRAALHLDTLANVSVILVIIMAVDLPNVILVITTVDGIRILQHENCHMIK
jgi:hypothetical protein